jgi:hypothetical protein
MHILTSSDGVSCVVTNDELRLCGVLCAMAESCPGDVIPLANVNGRMLLWLHQYLKVHVETEHPMRKCACMKLVVLNGEFLSIIRLANYLDIPYLHAQACMCVGRALRLCKTSEDMQRELRFYPDMHSAPLSALNYEESFALLVERVSSACVTPITN